MKTCWKESELLRNNPCFWGNTWAFYVCVDCGSRTHDAPMPDHHISAQEKTRIKKMKNSWQTVVKRADAPDFALFDLISIQIPLYCELASRKFMKIRCFGWSLCTFDHRLTRILNLNTSVFFLSRDMAIGDINIMRRSPTANAHVKLQRLTQLFPNSSDSFQHVFISSV